MKKGSTTTLSDDESSFDSDCGNHGKALISSILEGVVEDVSNISKKEEVENVSLTLEAIMSIWEEDLEVLKRQCDHIIALTKNKYHLMEMIATLKKDLSNA